MSWNSFQKELAKRRRRIKKLIKVFVDVAYRKNRDLKKSRILGERLRKEMWSMRDFAHKRRPNYWPRIVRDKVLLNAFATYDVADLYRTK